MTDLSGPAWDLSTEYASSDDPAIDADMDELARLLGVIEGRGGLLVDAVSRGFEFDDGQRGDAIEAARGVGAGGAPPKYPTVRVS